MTGTPTDRGYVLIRGESKGTKSVIVAGAISRAGRPTQVKAIHTEVASVDIAPNVAMTDGTRTERWSERQVDVHGDDAGTVHISAPRTGRGSLDRLV